MIKITGVIFGICIGIPILIVLWNSLGSLGTPSFRELAEITDKGEFESAVKKIKADAKITSRRQFYDCGHECVGETFFFDLKAERGGGPYIRDEDGNTDLDFTTFNIDWKHKGDWTPTTAGTKSGDEWGQGTLSLPDRSVKLDELVLENASLSILGTYLEADGIIGNAKAEGIVTDIKIDKEKLGFATRLRDGIVRPEDIQTVSVGTTYDPKSTYCTTVPGNKSGAPDHKYFCNGVFSGVGLTYYQFNKESKVEFISHQMTPPTFGSSADAEKFLIKAFSKYGSPKKETGSIWVEEIGDNTKMENQMTSLIFGCNGYHTHAKPNKSPSYNDVIIAGKADDYASITSKYYSYGLVMDDWVQLLGFDVRRGENTGEGQCVWAGISERSYKTSGKMGAPSESRVRVWVLKTPKNLSTLFKDY
jgi:hypothetical protein